MELKGGHKAPLYGLRSGSGNSIIYVDAEKMKTTFPFRITDYRSIEDLLNHKDDFQMVKDHQDFRYTND